MIQAIDAVTDEQKVSTEDSISVSRGALTSMFWFSGIMATICFLAAVSWLIIYQYLLFEETKQVILQAKDTAYQDFVLANQVQALLTQYTPVSSGTLAGVGLCFLGFAIISLNLKPSLGIEGGYEKAKIKFVNLSPGILIIIVAAVLIGFCISRYHPFQPSVILDQQPTTEQQQPNTALHPTPPTPAP